MSNKNLISYYSQRAREYEHIYSKPERQDDIRSLKAMLKDLFAGHNLLEIACGTGYWTEVIAKTARSIYATDANQPVLEIAKRKSYSQCNVKFKQIDAYHLAGINGNFSAGFAGFWWSHIPKDRIREFLNNFHAKLSPGALVVCMDNFYVEGSSLPITRQDDMGNTYQLRKLKDGTEHEVLKNFPDESELRFAVQNRAENVVCKRLAYYWCLSYNVKSF